MLADKRIVSLEEILHGTQYRGWEFVVFGIVKSKCCELDDFEGYRDKFIIAQYLSHLSERVC